MLCEDGSGTEYVHGLTTGGIIFKFAQNNVDLRSTPVNAFSADYRGSEFAGFQAEIAEGTEGTGSTRRNEETDYSEWYWAPASTALSPDLMSSRQPVRQRRGRGNGINTEMR